MRDAAIWLQRLGARRCAFVASFRAALQSQDSRVPGPSRFVLGAKPGRASFGRRSMDGPFDRKPLEASRLLRVGAAKVQRRAHFTRTPSPAFQEHSRAAPKRRLEIRRE